MNHLWADTEEELLSMVDKIGVQRKWIQKPPTASWVHFDISAGKRLLAIRHGAIATDRYEPARFRAVQQGNIAMVALIDQARLFEKEPWLR